MYRKSMEIFLDFWIYVDLLNLKTISLDVPKNYENLDFFIKLFIRNIVVTCVVLAIKKIENLSKFFRLQNKMK